MVTMSDVNEVWDKWGEYKVAAEQHMFPLIMVHDLKLEPLYQDLQKNWNESHAERFIKAMNNIVFPRFGIAT